jgi:mannan endo-1,4-beta-mannosidase
MLDSPSQKASTTRLFTWQPKYAALCTIPLLIYTIVLLGCDAVSTPRTNATVSRLSRPVAEIGRARVVPKREKPAKSTVPSSTATGQSPSWTSQPKPSSATQTTDPVLSSTTLLGISYGNSGWAMSDVSNMETWQGKKFATVELFSSWCPGDSKRMDNLFNIQLPNIWKNGNVPVLTWQPYICGASSTPTNVDALIAAGEYDSYLTQFANRVNLFVAGTDGVIGSSDDRRLYVRMGHEMNGDWYPWSANSSGQTPAQFVAMWRHVHDIFSSNGLDPTHLQWIWCVGTKDSSRNYPAETYYPGDAYVDWIGMDGYNFGDQTFGANTFSWKTPDQIFSAMLTRMHGLAAKPIGIMETGSSATTTSGVSYSAKNQWTEQLFSYALNQQIRMVIWFNHDAPLWGSSCCKLGDWGVFGGTLGDGSYITAAKTYLLYTAYKPAVSSAELVSSESTNGQLLSDTLFIGK